jgi:hypothetical protein
VRKHRNSKQKSHQTAIDEFLAAIGDADKLVEPDPLVGIFQRFRGHLRELQIGSSKRSILQRSDSARMAQPSWRRKEPQFGTSIQPLCRFEEGGGVFRIAASREKDGDRQAGLPRVIQSASQHRKGVDADRTQTVQGPLGQGQTSMGREGDKQLLRIGPTGQISDDMVEPCKLDAQGMVFERLPCERVLRPGKTRLAG